MIFLTHLPNFVAIIFRGLPGVWKSRHKLIFCWFVYTQPLTPNKKTVTELSKWSPAVITEELNKRIKLPDSDSLLSA